jgi:hypothetical protein
VCNSEIVDKKKTRERESERREKEKAKAKRSSFSFHRLVCTSGNSMINQTRLKTDRQSKSLLSLFRTATIRSESLGDVDDRPQYQPGNFQEEKKNEKTKQQQQQQKKTTREMCL